MGLMNVRRMADLAEIRAGRLPRWIGFEELNEECMHPHTHSLCKGAAILQRALVLTKSAEEAVADIFG